jgi:hypothetical protein
MDRDLVASNADRSRFWRAENISDVALREYRFRLTGGPVSRADFGRGGELRLWEYGVGDTVRQVTFVSLHRIGENVYRLSANVDLALALPGKGLEISTDGSTWNPLEFETAAGMASAAIPLADLAPGGAAQIRVR